MKLDFNRARFEAAMDIGVEASKAVVAADPNLQMTEETIGDLPPVLQFQYRLFRDKGLQGSVSNIMMTMLLCPESTIGIVLAAGYEMGKQDARKLDEADELAKLFALPSEPQGETNV